jgi:outer membrane protein W
MKKSILTVSLFLSGLFAFAQNETKPVSTAFSIGPSVGLGHAFMYPYITRGINPVGNFGIISTYAPTEHWGIGGDVRYSIEGSKTRTEQGPRDTDLDYLRVVPKGIYFFGTYDEDFRPKITLGPSIGFLMKHTDTFESTINPIDVGVIATTGFNYRLSQRGMWLNLDVYYYQGLTDVKKHTGTTELNANVGLNLGLAFGL